MEFKPKRVLGKTGLAVGRLGVAAGYGAPTESFLKAFDRGCNYFYWGSFRRDNMGRAIRQLCGQGKRGELVIVVQVYNRVASMMAASVERALKKAKLDYADVLLLGWHNSMPAPRIVEAAQRLKASGKVKFLAVSGHHRPAFPKMAETGAFDVLHIRYNAAHRGAEEQVFPKLPEKGRPGIVTYTATRWGKLLKPGKMPPGEKTPRASDCYRFALTHPAVDVVMTGPKNAAEMDEALATLDRGPLSEDEMKWMRKVGDYVHG
ncbi:MAG TPA: aldo/keto reductase [bacterium]|nr:aldo/keto reductase [bacterium]